LMSLITCVSLTFICSNAFCIRRTSSVAHFTRCPGDAGTHATSRSSPPAGRNPAASQTYAGSAAMAIRHIRLAAELLEVRRIDQEHLESPLLQQLVQRNPITPVDSIATVSTPQRSSQSAIASRSAVNVSSNVRRLPDHVPAAPPRNAPSPPGRSPPRSDSPAPVDPGTASPGWLDRHAGPPRQTPGAFSAGPAISAPFAPDRGQSLLLSLT